jgi:hypothetical protein
MDVSIIQPVREAFLGRSIRPEVNETAPEVLSPRAAAGNCLIALTRQPLRRPGQPKAAAPDSGIRAASAPGERSCLHGKPMAETGQLYFPGVFLDAVPGPGRRRHNVAGATRTVDSTGPVSRGFLSTVIRGRVRLRARPTDWPGRARTARGELWMGSAVRMERGAAGRGARTGWMGTIGDGIQD